MAGVSKQLDHADANAHPAHQPIKPKIAHLVTSAKNLRQEINVDDLDLETIANMVMSSKSLPLMLKAPWSTKMAVLMATIDVIVRTVDQEAPAKTAMEMQDVEDQHARKLEDLELKVLEEAKTVQPMPPMVGTEVVSERVANTILKAFSFQP